MFISCWYFTSNSMVLINIQNIQTVSPLNSNNETLIVMVSGQTLVVKTADVERQLWNKIHPK